MADSLVGRSLGPYRVLERLARGGMAVVYRGYQPSLDRYVAIKVLPPQMSEHEAFLSRFRQEASAIGRLRHPNILTAYDFGEQEGVAYIVMELVPGRTLRERLGEPLDPKYVALIARQMGGALDEAHRNSIIHRDVKPSNILLPSEDWGLLSDFGVAKVLEESSSITRTGMGVGTPEYMSPEQGQGQPVSARSDVYSLAVVVYEMLVGRAPFRGDTPMTVMLKHLSSEPQPLAELVPSLPPGLQEVVMRGLRKRPSDRYGTAGDFAAALSRVIDSSPTNHRAIEAPSAPPVGLVLPEDYAGEGDTDTEAQVVTFLDAWGAMPPGAPARYPARLSAGPDGTLLVSDAIHHRIQCFQPDGTLIWQRGRSGSRPGEFDSPAGAAYDIEGNVYVADQGNHRVQKLDRQGRPLRCWGGEGQEAGYFDGPDGVAVDSAGHIFVADSHNHRVQCFTPDGALLSVVGGPGSGPGEFEVPLGLAVDPLDRLYVVDSENQRVQVFDASGRFLSRWASHELFDSPEGIAISRGGIVLIADTRHHRVLRFSLDGELLENWGGDGEFELPRAVAIDPVGDVYLAETGKPGLRKFNPAGEMLARWQSAGSALGAFDEPRSIAVEGDRVFVCDIGNRRVQSFDLEGHVQGIVPLPPGSASWSPRALGAHDGTLLVADGEAHAVWRLRRTRWERLPRTGEELRLVVPEGACLDGAGNVYALDWARDLVVKVDSSGRVRGRWGHHGKGRREFDWLRGIACDGRSTLYVADGGNDRVQRLDLRGEWAGTLGRRGGAPGEFRTPAAVAVRPDGTLLVADEGNHRIQWLKPDGACIAVWGSLGDGPGQFDHPRSVACDRYGNVYVADAGNNRVQKFALSG